MAFFQTPDFGPIPSFRDGSFGSLGGLGGQQTPPAMFNSPMAGNLMQAIGMSLLASPRNNPFQNLPDTLAYTQKSSEQREEKAREEGRLNQTKQYLLSKGFSEAEADAAVGNPAILSSFLKQLQGGEQQGLMNTGEGIYNPNTGEWIMPPNSGKSSEYALREQAAQQQGLQPGTREYQNFVLTGKMATEEDRGLSATEHKELWQSEDEIPSLDYTIDSLNRAEDLNDKTFTGWGAEAAGRLGTQAPGGALIFNQEKAKATNEFSKLMSMEAIQAMAATLKGATTDAELARFVDILADPSTDPQIRGSTIKRMKSLAENRRRIKLRRIQEIKGQSMPEAGAPPPGARRTSTGVDWSM